MDRLGSPKADVSNNKF